MGIVPYGRERICAFRGTDESVPYRENPSVACGDTSPAGEADCHVTALLATAKDVGAEIGRPHNGRVVNRPYLIIKW